MLPKFFRSFSILSGITRPARRNYIISSISTPARSRYNMVFSQSLHLTIAVNTAMIVFFENIHPFFLSKSGWQRLPSGSSHAVMVIHFFFVFLHPLPIVLLQLIYIFAIVCLAVFFFPCLSSFCAIPFPIYFPVFFWILLATLLLSVGVLFLMRLSIFVSIAGSAHSLPLMGLFLTADRACNNNSLIVPGSFFGITTLTQPKPNILSSRFAY